MANLQYYDIIQKPVVTEKTMAAMGEKKYTFYVHPDSNKVQIRQAIEKMFDGTKVEYVNTMNLTGKKMRRGRTIGKRADRKKAVIQLSQDSNEIELLQGM